MSRHHHLWIATLAFTLLAGGVTACGGGGETVESLVSRGADAMGRGEFDAAEEHFRGAVELLDKEGAANPELELRARLGLARCMIRNGAAEKGKSDFLALQPEFAAQLTWKDFRSVAAALTDENETTAAIEILDLGVQTYPDHATALKEEIRKIQDRPDLSPETMEQLKKLGYVK
jgi:tetratricopeptide (TPR) repeat protein